MAQDCRAPCRTGKTLPLEAPRPRQAPSERAEKTIDLALSRRLAPDPAARDEAEPVMSLYLLALLIGVVAGLRAMTAPAAVAWAARLGWLPLAGFPLSWLGGVIPVLVLTVLAALELVADQLPKTPSRKVPVQFIARVLTGAFSGAALMMPSGHWLRGAVIGAVGAVLGTFAGAEARARLAKRFGKDQPAALIEDVVAVGGALLIVALAR
jgi:uncharacterized membrane protein